MIFIKYEINFNCFIFFFFFVEDCQGIIIYARENRQASFIAAYLSELDYSSAYIGSDYEIPKQKMALEEFKKKKVKILVATLAASVEKGTYI